MKLFLSPHNDDETLFGAFTIMRERPIVLVVFDSFVQAKVDRKVKAAARRQESIDALARLGLPQDMVLFAGLCDDEKWNECETFEAITRTLGKANITEIFSPAFEERGHEQHNLVARAAQAIAELNNITLTQYTTYTRHAGRTRTSKKVTVADGDWIRRKHLALACYPSQYMNAALGCRPWFTGDLEEYYL